LKKKRKEKKGVWLVISDEDDGCAMEGGRRVKIRHDGRRSIKGGSCDPPQDRERKKVTRDRAHFIVNE